MKWWCNSSLKEIVNELIEKSLKKNQLQRSEYTERIWLFFHLCHSHTIYSCRPLFKHFEVCVITILGNTNVLHFWVKVVYCTPEGYLYGNKVDGNKWSLFVVLFCI